MAESNGSCRAVLLPDARTRSKAGGGKKHSSELPENRDRHDHELKRVAPLYPASKRQRRTSAETSGNTPEHEEIFELHRLLGALLSQNLSVNEKLNIIGNEYDIPMEEDFREDVSVMCNLSQKIKVTGIETGIEIGKKEMIVKMHSKGYTIAQIADVAGMEEKRIEEIIKNEELLPA